MTQAAVKLNLKTGTKYIELEIYEYRKTTPVFKVHADGQADNLLTASQIRASWNAWVRNDLRNHELKTSTTLAIY